MFLINSYLMLKKPGWELLPFLCHWGKISRGVGIPLTQIRVNREIKITPPLYYTLTLIIPPCFTYHIWVVILSFLSQWNYWLARVSFEQFWVFQLHGAWTSMVFEFFNFTVPEPAWFWVFQFHGAWTSMIFECFNFAALEIRIIKHMHFLFLNVSNQ